jgi:uncharacterized protein
LVELLKVLLVFVLIIRLLQQKWNLGGVMLIGAAALGLLMGMGPAGILGVAWRSSIEWSGVSVMVALALIMVLENILRKTGTLKRLVDSSSGLLGDRRLVMGLMPAIIGVLPSAGGAYFSAPMVEASSGGAQIRPERKSFINYWFRHIWEYISPLYPGFIITASIAQVPMGKLFLYQVAFPLTVIATGAIFAFRGVGKEGTKLESKGKLADMLSAVTCFSPILAVMLMVMIMKVDISLAMVIVVASLFVYFRYSPSRVWATLKESISVKTLLLVLGVNVFKGIMEGSGAVNNLPAFFQSTGVPVEAVLFILPFLVGMITGITLAFVGVTFPLILPLIGGTAPDLSMLAFAYASGFAGVMFSPVHLCLVLTKEYFKAEFIPIFRLMLVPELIVLAVAFAQMVLL